MRTALPYKRAKVGEAKVQQRRQAPLLFGAASDNATMLKGDRQTDRLACTLFGPPDNKSNNELGIVRGQRATFFGVGQQTGTTEPWEHSGSRMSPIVVVGLGPQGRLASAEVPITD